MENDLLPDPAPFDHNSFILDWAVLFDDFALIIVLAFVAERALALDFETENFFNLINGDIEAIIEIKVADGAKWMFP